jgi:hypothetical protein
MTCEERERPDSRRPAGISWGFVVLAVLSARVARAATDSAEPAPLGQALAVVQDCMVHSPAPWPDAWQREYLTTIREALSSDPNRPNYATNIEVFRRGFLRYWAQTQASGLTQTEYDLRRAEMRWYCETVMAAEPASASEKAVLKGQLRDLCDYAAEYLQGRFPFLKAEYVEAAKKAALAEFEREVDSPLLPIFRRPLSEDQLRAVKANWARLYRRWYFIWREVRYEGAGQEDRSALQDVASHPHYLLVKRCLSYVPQTTWPTLERPPTYVVDAIRKFDAEKAERGRINRQVAQIETDLAMRSSNQVEQVEEWSFILTGLLETANTSNGLTPSLSQSLKGGDAYDLRKEP